MKMKIRFPKALIWGSIALLLFALAGCPLPVDSESSGQEDTEESWGQNPEDNPENEDTEESRGQNPEDNPENEDGDNEGQNSGDEKNDPEDDNDDSGENEEDKNDEVTPSGNLVIRIGEITKSEGVYPDLSGVTRYLLNFNGEGGKTAEDLYLETGKELTVTLDPGNWEIRAYGLAENEAGEPLLAAIFGTTRVTVRENETENVLIAPNVPAAEGDYFEIDGVIFPPAISFSSTSELKAFLDAHPENTADTPYPVKITGVDLSTKEGTGETLKTLYDTLSRYVTLDLRECTGTELPSASSRPTLTNREKVVSLILPDSITSIAGNGFAKHTNLKSVVLPKVTTIDYAAFGDLGKLETVSAPELTDLVDSTKAASTSAKGNFYRCTALRSIYFPKLEALGHHAFYGCTSLTEMAFLNVRTVEAFAFKGCTVLKSVILPAVTKIDKNSFENDTALTHLTLGPTPPELGKNAFGGSNFLQNGAIYVPASAVDAYKESPAWSTMEDRIYPITD
jgi:hypothetical protein